MGQQLSDIRTDALDVFGYNANDPLLDSTTLNRLVNGALRQLSAEYDWPWLYEESNFSTVAGTSDYAVPARWKRTAWVAIEDIDLQVISPRDMRSYVGDPDRKGHPAFWTPVGDSHLRLGPTPDQVYSVDHGYFAYEAELSDDTDVTALSAEFDDMLVMYVAKKLAMRKGEMAQIRLAQEEINGWKRRARDEVRKSTQLLRVKTRRDTRPGI